MSQQRHAPLTSPRPKARPVEAGPDIIGPTRPPDFAKTGDTPGMYDGLGIQDDTDKYGDLGVRDRNGAPSEVILHQTMSTTGASTEGAYASRIARGQHVGAHYLVDEQGDTSLTVPTDEVVYHAKGHNSSAIGIETVGMPEQVDQRADMHEQIGAMALSPKLKDRLMSMGPKELARTLANNGNYIYQDITGPQKRANWNLLRAIAAEHGISLDADVDAHEHVQAKTIGEGENIEEMVDTMLHWPGKIEALESRIGELERNHGNPGLLVELKAELETQKADYEAVSLDKTTTENNALEGEAILGELGPAAERENRREQFWDEFYPNMDRLDGLIEDKEGPDRQV